MSEGLSLRSLGSRRSQGEDLRIHEISVRRTGTVALGRKVARNSTPDPDPDPEQTKDPRLSPGVGQLGVPELNPGLKQ